MTIRADRRKIETRPRPDLHRRCEKGWRSWIASILRLAGVFAEILESPHSAEESCATLEE